jgi:hypothetical protein
MRRWITPLVVAIAVVVMGAAASSANAASVSFSTTTTTATASSITLRDASLFNMISSRTLSLSFNATTACDGSNEVQIGEVTGGSGTMSSPAGYTWSFTTPWGIWTRCAVSGGSLAVTFRSVVFSSTLGLLGPYTYSGSFSATLNAAGSTLSGVSSAFTSDRRSSAAYITPFAFGSSPSLGWSYTP